MRPLERPWDFCDRRSILGRLQPRRCRGLSDIPAFVEILQAGTFLSEADGNQDGEVTFADIPRVYCNSDCQLGGLSTAFHRVLVDGQPITISDSPF